MADKDEDLEEGKMPLLDHLIELRQRLIYSALAWIIAFIPCAYFSGPIYEFLAAPLRKILNGGPFIFTDITDPFFTHLRVAFWLSLFVAFPAIAFQVWRFVAPGLYRNERRAFLPYLVASPILFILGAALAYYAIFPLAFGFFASFQQPAADGNGGTLLMPTVGDYLTLVLRLIFAFGVTFQMPVLLTLMARVGLVTSAGLLSKWRYAVVVITAAAGILTPPDVFSMTALMLPLYALYGVSILCCRLIEKQRAKREAAEEAELFGKDDDKTGKAPGGG
jgi:sec-independent protein translocase protein TatC